MAWTSDDLIASVKRKASAPDAQALWASSDFLAVADEEIRSYVLPLIRRAQEEYYLQSSDFAITAATTDGIGQSFRIPYRATGGTLRDVYVLDSYGNVVGTPRISADDLENSLFGAYLFSNHVFYVCRNSSVNATTLRMIYYLRPSALVLSSGAGQVVSWDADAKTVQIGAVPSGFPTSGQFDILKGKPGFEMLGFDFPASRSGDTLTFVDALPTDIAIGDWVCTPETTPIPQIPAELHPLLAEKVAIQWLQAQDPEAAAARIPLLQRLEADALVLITQRMGGEPKKAKPAARGLWRGWHR